MDKLIKEELDYCLMIIENAKNRNNTGCQVPIFAEAETLNELKNLNLNFYQVGFDKSDSNSYIQIKF